LAKNDIPFFSASFASLRETAFMRGNRTTRQDPSLPMAAAFPCRPSSRCSSAGNIIRASAERVILAVIVLVFQLLAGRRAI
jgi:hypothetical protein